MDSPEMAIINIEQREQSLIKWLDHIEITTTGEQKNCEDMLIIARRVYKEAEIKRKEALEPVKAEDRRINDLFKPFIERLSNGINTVNKALQDWHSQQKRLAEWAQLEAMKKQDEAMDALKTTGEIIELSKIDIPIVPKTSHADVGTVTYREGFEIQIVNPDSVPRDLCDPSPSKIRKRIESGVKEISGVLIIPKTITVTRRAQ